MTSPAVLAEDVLFLLAGNDISGDGNELGIDVSQDSHDVTTFGAEGWKDKLIGFASAALSFKAYYNKATGKGAETAWSMVGASGPTAFVAQLEGNTPGNPQYTGNINLTKYSPRARVNAPLSLDLAFDSTGAVIRGTVA